MMNRVQRPRERAEARAGTPLQRAKAATDGRYAVLQRAAGNLAAIRLLQRSLSSASSPSGAAVQRKLDKKPKINEFVEDVGADGRQKDIKTALQKLLDHASHIKLPVEYDWLVSQVKGIKGLNAGKIDGLRERLLEERAKGMDQEMSGDRGHMIGRHVAVDKDFQEERLDGGLARATRIDMNDQYGERYLAYLEVIKEQAPKLVKERFEKVVKESHDVMTLDDYGYRYMNANGDKKSFLEDMLDSEDIETDDFTLSFDWKVRVAGAGLVTLTCEPTLTSTAENFKKTITEKDQRSGRTVEYTEVGNVTMYWGSNRIKVENITHATTGEQLNQLLEGIDYTLGVTQF